MTTPVCLTCPYCQHAFVGAGYQAIALDYILHICEDATFSDREYELVERDAEKVAEVRGMVAPINVRSTLFREGRMKL